ncbi:MAG: 3-oxoacyl-[acyl-carrier-protein] reductase FabG [Jatrophihabitantaceae bacterium]|nr:3-oxoacyl-[acyl-carrier-protein] reductase FabG [Jatrophihabitantaceae bacterium]
MTIDDTAARPSALVTGGSRGIGFGIAQLLARRGWDLTLAARRADQLQRAANDLGGYGGSVQVVPGDIADDAVLDEVVTRHSEAYGGMSGLILAAGVGTAGAISGYPMGRFDKQIAVNVRAPYALVSRALPLLRRSAAQPLQVRSRIVALSSIEGVFPESGLAAYGASKAALISLIRSINVEENGNGVLATAISPAFVATELSAWATESVPFDRMISVADVVCVVEMLLGLSFTASIEHLVLNRVGAGPYRA